MYIYIYMDYNKFLRSAQCSDLVKVELTDYETINNNLSITPLHCVLMDFHPIFGLIQFILNLENMKYATLFKNYSNVVSKIFVI